MANYYCRPTQFKIVDRDVINVLVPSGQTYHAGQVIMVKNFVSKATLAGNISVFEGVAPTTADLGLYAALVINGGDFEQMADGRRPEGNPDYTSATYTYPAGAIAPAILLEVGVEFEISTDAVGAGTAVGKYLEPANAQNYLQVVNSRTGGVKSGLKILAENVLRSGGMFGASFIDTVIARVLE